MNLFQIAIKVISRDEQSKSFIGKIIALGKVLVNRAVDIQNKTIILNSLTDFDKYAINYAISRGCKEVYASFISSSEQIIDTDLIAAQSSNII